MTAADLLHNALMCAQRAAALTRSPSVLIETRGRLIVDGLLAEVCERVAGLLEEVEGRERATVEVVIPERKAA